MTELHLMRGDITTLEVDAIVNAANPSLMGGGGVDGAIHRAGGPDILAACKAVRDRQGRLAAGDAVATTAGLLPAQWVIHTVGPVYGDHQNAEAAQLLASCYTRSLEVATEIGAVSIAFPNISTGVYGYPKADAADVAVDAVTDWIAANDARCHLVRCVRRRE